MLCPLILTTVSEELDVEELTSFTISPGEKRRQHLATAWDNLLGFAAKNDFTDEEIIQPEFICFFMAVC